MKNIKLQSSEIKNDEISISIVHDYKENDFKNFYRIFDLKRPVENVGLIGVESLDQFAIKINRKEIKDFAFSLYLDGVSVSQKNGIKSLSEIKENERDDYKKHNKFICRPYYKKNTFFIDRYSQKSDKNRKFVFTDISNTGINENLINDPSKQSRIEIYFWSEKPKEVRKYTSTIDYNLPLFSPIISEDMKIGAGEETNQKFGSTTDLDNPVYLGKIMFIYVDQKFIKLNKDCKIPKKEDFDFNDPMDLIPNPLF